MPFQSIILQNIAYIHSQEPLTFVEREPRPPLTGQELHPPLSPVVREHFLGHLCTRTAETTQEGGGQGREGGGRRPGEEGGREKSYELQSRGGEFVVKLRVSGVPLLLGSEDIHVYTYTYVYTCTA